MVEAGDLAGDKVHPVKNTERRSYLALSGRGTGPVTEVDMTIPVSILANCVARLT